MKISLLELQNFRSYSELNLSLTDGITVFVGENGQGKTNIVEAILYLASLSSHRVSGNQPLIHNNENQALIRVVAENEERKLSVDLEINSHKANRARINSTPTKTQREILGIVKAVYFSPEDLDLVRGDPTIRRGFIDQLLVMHTPRLISVLSDYERVLKQRNTLLKTRAPESALTPWDEQLAKLGGEVIASRITLLNELHPYFQESYSGISSVKKATFDYKSSLSSPTANAQSNAVEILLHLQNTRAREYERGVTLIGPHRDDLNLFLGNFPVKGYASHGESWSVALALKIGTFHLIKNSGVEPILILDDVFSELDENRRDRLVNLAISVEQAIITVAVENDLPAALEGSRFRVHNGRVTNDEVPE